MDSRVIRLFVGALLCVVAAAAVSLASSGGFSTLKAALHNKLPAAETAKAPAIGQGTDEAEDRERPVTVQDLVEVQQGLVSALRTVSLGASAERRHMVSIYAGGLEEAKRSLGEDIRRLRAEVAELKASLEQQQKPKAATKRAPKPQSAPLAPKTTPGLQWSATVTRTLHAVNLGVPPISERTGEP